MEKKGSLIMTQDMTQGKIMPMLVHFTIPLVLGNLFQLTYNAVDSIIVGHFVGKEALAAVGICNPITTLFILFLGSLTLARSQNSQMSFMYGFFFVKFLIFAVVCVVIMI